MNENIKKRFQICPPNGLGGSGFISGKNDVDLKISELFA